MAEENMNLNDQSQVKESASKSKSKNVEKKPNFFVRLWKKIVKLTTDTVGELKKVVWTPRADVIKNFKLVVGVVVAVALIIAVIDFCSSMIINSIAGLIG